MNEFTETIGIMWFLVSIAGLFWVFFLYLPSKQEEETQIKSVAYQTQIEVVARAKGIEAILLEQKKKDERIEAMLLEQKKITASSSNFEVQEETRKFKWVSNVSLKKDNDINLEITLKKKDISSMTEKTI